MLDLRNTFEIDNYYSIRLSSIFNYTLTNLIILLYVLYLYNFLPNTVTLMLGILIPILLLPFFVLEDLMNPFNIFFMSHFFLSLINIIDVNINQNTLRYGLFTYEEFDKIFAYSLMVILIWIVFVYIGFHLSKNSKNGYFIKKFSFSLNRPVLISFIFLLIAILTFLYTISAWGGLSGMIEAAQNRTVAYAGNNYLGKLVMLGAFSPLILLLYGYKKTSFLIMLLVFLMVSLYGGRSGAFFGVVFPYLICYHYKVRKIRMTDLILVGGFGVLFSIYFGQYRVYQNFNVNLDNITDILTSAANYTQMGDILPSLVGSLKNNHVPYAYGSTLINIFLSPIPRSIWQNKPMIDESSIIGDLLIGDNSWGLPPGPYGIAYYNFGIIGVIILGLVVGFVVGYLYKNLINSTTVSNSNMSIVYYSIVIKYFFELFSTSAQINIIWYSVFFLSIKYIDVFLGKK